MGGSIKERNYFLDFIKLIACIFIILRHISPLGDGWTAVATVTRCFVPFFFMVAGYYCFRSDGTSKRIAPKILYLSKLTIITYLLYVVVKLVAIYRYGEECTLKLSELPREIFNLVVFNQPIFIPEFVWFLFALIYVYAIYALVQKFNLYRAMYVAMPILFLGSLILTYGGLIFNFEVSNFYYRNFIFEGLPFFIFGHFVHKHQDKIRISNLWLIVALVISTALVLVEVNWTGRNFDLNITNSIQIVAIFLLAVKNSDFGKGVLANLGRDLSLYVYVIHIAIRRIVLAVYSILGWESQIYFDIFPVVVMIVSLIASFILFRIIKFVGSKRRKTT